jgi:hypothetical protein
MPKEIKGKNGGTLIPLQAGDPAPPGAGRKPNPFKHHIQELAETQTEIVLKGRLIGEDGSPTSSVVEVAVSLPGALGIVMKAYKSAAKGDAQARKWLTETGWGKSLNLVGDPDSPLEGGFVIMLPSNER